MVTLFLFLLFFFFHDQACTNKIFCCFTLQTSPGAFLRPHLSEARQIHPAATKARKRIMYHFSDIPENTKIKPLQGRFIQIQTHAQVTYIILNDEKNKHNLIDILDITSYSVCRTSTTTFTENARLIPGQPSDISIATAWLLFSGRSLQNAFAFGEVCANIPVWSAAALLCLKHLCHIKMWRHMCSTTRSSIKRVSHQRQIDLNPIL